MRVVCSSESFQYLKCLAEDDETVNNKFDPTQDIPSCKPPDTLGKIVGSRNLLTTEEWSRNKNIYCNFCVLLLRTGFSKRN